MFILYHKRHLQIRLDAPPAGVSSNLYKYAKMIYYYIPYRLFLKVKLYFGQQSESIPMSFVLGFYVNLIVRRWWEQYRLLPWPDTLALFISAAIPNSNGVNVRGSALIT